MNSTLYWDNLETKHSALACSPIGGDPEYQLVCAYVGYFLGSGLMIVGVGFLICTHLYLQTSNASKTKRSSSKVMATVSTFKSSRLSGKLLRLQSKRDLPGSDLPGVPHSAKVSICIAIAAFSGSLALIFCGGGTSYSVSSTRGQLGDAFSEYFD
jgi:hypothetical protein